MLMAEISLLPKGDDPLVHGLFGVESTTESPKAVLVPCKGGSGDVLQVLPFLDEPGDKRFFSVVFVGSC
jgi:hypothetical protein